MLGRRMNPNERLLRRVMQERSGQGRFVGLRSGWILFGTVALVVLAAVLLVRMISFGNTDRPARVDAHASDSDIPTAPAIDSSHVAPVATAFPPAATSVSRPARYVVQPGDSLQSIAARAGLRPATLASVNQLDEPDLLQPGSSLVIPPTDGVIHVVEPGETLRTIAERYGVEAQRIINVNQLEDPDHIPVGLRLFIPTDSDAPE